MRSKMAVGLFTAALLAASALPALAAGRGWLGVTTQATDEDLRRGLDLTRDGLLVNQVSEDSPADRAGLRKGDVILSYNSRTVTEPEDLRQLVRDTEPGRTVSLGIWRDGSRRSLEVTVGELPGGEDDESMDVPTPPTPPDAPRAPRAPRDRDGEVHRRMIINGREVPEDEMRDRMKDLHIKLKGLDELKNLKGMEGFGNGQGSMFFAPAPGRGRLGVRVEKMSDELGDALGADGDQGVLVLEVIGDTPAQRAGLRAGDVITKVGDDSVDSPEELVKALADRDGRVSLTVVRKGSRRTVEAELGARDGDREGRVRTYVAPRARTLRGIPEPGPGGRVYRERTKDDAGDEADLREQIRQLKQELRELKEQVEEKK